MNDKAILFNGTVSENKRIYSQTTMGLVGGEKVVCGHWCFLGSDSHIDGIALTDIT